MRPRFISVVAAVISIGLWEHGQGAPASIRAAQPPVCKCIPSTAALDAGFQLAGVGRLGKKYPRLPRIGVDSAIVPPVILKAVAWTESNWRQFNSENVPLISPDFGYGVMQITTGMAGAGGHHSGTLPLWVQGRIGGDYLYNIAYGARFLAQLFKTMPSVNDRDPTVLEDWYYALWAYNGWGWANNPNNPGFTRQGTPASNPGAFPYQERVYYLVQHPPVGPGGRALWTPMKVVLPDAASISREPSHIHTSTSHRELPHLYGASYDVPNGLTAVHVGSKTAAHVTVYNSSGVPWPLKTVPAYGLVYHWVEPGHQGAVNYKRSLGGVDVLDGIPVPVNRSVAIGGRIRFAVRVTAPATAGKYVLEWDMWAGKAGWFSQNSVPTGKQVVDVVPVADSIPPYVDTGVPRYLSGNHAWFVTPITDSVASVLQPNETYSETLLFFNPGGMAWTDGYRLHRLDQGSSVKLPINYLASCRTVPITLGGQAPEAVGTYQYVWRFQGSKGRLFGPRIVISFRVAKATAAILPKSSLVNRLI